MKKTEVFKGVNWFLAALLVLQGSIVVIHLFNFQIPLVDEVEQFFAAASVFISVICGLFVFWFIAKRRRAKKANRKDFGFRINIVLSLLNIVLVNKFYDNKALRETKNDIFAFFAETNSNIILFVALLLAVAICIAVYIFARPKYERAGPLERPEQPGRQEQMGRTEHGVHGNAAEEDAAELPAPNSAPVKVRESGEGGSTTGEESTSEGETEPDGSSAPEET